MTKTEKIKYLTDKTIGYYSFGYVGLEIKGFIFDIDDYIIYVGVDHKIHKSKIYYNTRGEYFNYGTRRIKMSEILRTL